MWPLIKKNSIFFISYVLPFTVFLILYWFIESKANDPNFVMVIYFWMWILTIGFISSGEQQEAKNKGYEFLQILPVTDAEIVASKFLLTLILVVFIVCFDLALLSFFKGTTLQLKTILFFVPVNGMASLLLAGLLFIGVFKFGFSLMHKVFWAVTFGAVAVMILTVELLLPKIRAHLPAIIDFLTHISWIFRLLAVGVVLYCYYLMMKLAIKVKIAAKE
jgi:hypothetical protein